VNVAASAKAASTSAARTRRGRRILATQAQIFPAYWSPDGRRIAFGVLGRLNDATACGQSVWTIRADGSDLHLVSDCALLPRDSGTNEQPWAPDSSRLVFLGHVQPPTVLVANLAVANLDGTGRRDFSSVVHVADAAWAPRGERIAFATAGAKPHFFDLGVIDAGSGSVVRLGQGSSPTWSHSGSRLAFVDGSVYYSSRVFVGTISFGSKGPHRTRLATTYIVGRSLIAWSPNDRGLAFVGCRASRSCKQSEVYFVRTDGTRLHQVTDEHDIGYVEFEGIWWAPTGRQLFFSRYRLGVG
jgi:Tol biopolymer transport system component